MSGRYVYAFEIFLAPAKQVALTPCALTAALAAVYSCALEIVQWRVKVWSMNKTMAGNGRGARYASARAAGTAELRSEKLNTSRDTRNALLS